MSKTKTNSEQQALDYANQLLEDYGASQYAIINTETGEIEELPNGTRVKKPKALNRDRFKRIRTEFMPKEKFVKVYKKAIDELSNTLSYRDFNWFIRTSQYTGIGDCILYDNEGNYLDVMALSKLLGLNYDNYRKAFNNFIKEGMAKKVKVPSQYYINRMVDAIAINPYIYFNGEYAVEEIRQEFDATRWAQLYHKVF